MRLRPEALFSVAVLVLFAWAVWEARHWPLQARMFPWVVGLPMIALALLQLALDLRGAPRKRGLEAQFGEGLDPAVVRRRLPVILGWLLGFFVLITLLGFPLAVPLGTFLYLKVGSREGWLLSLLLTVGAGVAFYGLFGYLLNTPFPDGLLFTWLAWGE